MASPSDSPERDRAAYLEEQIQKQKRGEPIDVEWVKAELERVRIEQTRKIAATQRNLLWLTIGSAVLLFLLWIRAGGFDQHNGTLVFGLIVVGALAAWGLTRRRR